MTNKEVYKIWAPYGKDWTMYARPVAFVNMPEFLEKDFEELYVPEIDYIDKFDASICYIVDLPNERAIEEGLAIAKYGYRPIPLFNGTLEPINSIATTNNHMIERPLAWGATVLQKMKIEDNAPPVFLVDQGREARFKLEISYFDNSYDMYDQDFPTAKALLEKGINKVIIRTKKLENDMRMILSNYQKQGIKIYKSYGIDKPKKVRVTKPLFYKN